MSSNTKPLCRWGFLSAAGIARKNWQSIRVSGNGTLIAVAARQRAAAEEFVESCQAHSPFPQTPEVVDDYQSLIERKDIDALYIALPTAIRGEWIRKAIEAGKHVLAEKPAGLHAAEVEELVRLAAQKNVQYMDGVMFMHSARLAKMREVLDDGTSVGKLRRVATHFSFRGSDEFFVGNIRTDSRFEPHGCLGDLGWYCLRMILWAKRFELPKQVSGRILQTLRGNASPAAVPGEFSGELLYDDGFSAHFYCSFLTENQQWAHLSGERGHLYLRDFVLPHYGCEARFEVANPVFRIDGCDFHMQERATHYSVHEYSDGHAGAQEVELFRHFGDLVLSGKPDPRWGEITLATQRVMDAAMRSAENGSSWLKP